MLKLDRRDLELFMFIAEKREPTITEMENHFSREWGVSKKAVYLRIKRLEENGFLKLYRVTRSIVRVSFSTDFLALIEMIYGLMHGQAKYWYDRVRKKWIEGKG